MYMKKSVGPVSALTVRHSLIQLGSGASTRQVSGGGSRGRSPRKVRRSCILQYQNDQKQQDYLYFRVSEQNCPILPDPIAEKLGKMSFHIGQS